MTTYTISELHDKRSELAGEIIQTEKRVKQLRDDLAHVEATIRILRPGIDLPKLVPKRVEYRPRYFKRGALALTIRNYMREHGEEPVAVVDMMPLAIGERTINPAEYQKIAIGVYDALRRMERKGSVQRVGQGWKVARWTLAETT
ncbi:MAG TPA: hypothetical protein VHY35_01555 [Stellaceae bacterium]|jgi:hypothetical protein|nr:hypothetical protein [Stellaceae bacterium]